MTSGGRRLRGFLVATGLATAIGLLFAAQWVLSGSVVGNAVTWPYALAWVLPDWYLWAALCPLAFALAARFPVTAGARAHAAILHIALGTAISVFHAGLFALVTWRLPWASIAHLSLGQLAANLVRKKGLTNLLVYFLLVGVEHALAFRRREAERALRASRLEGELARAHLQTLRMQLHPHFLFNALHAISELIHRDTRAADRMVSRLGDMLRATLESDGKDEVPLRHELDLLERYLDIERVRFRDRLEVSVEIAPDCLDAAVPSLILQPLVENAIHHGIASRPGASRVEIRAERTGASLVLRVSDDGLGLSPDAPAPPPGIGLSNSRARLAQLYGQRQRLELRNGHGRGLEVILEIPYTAAGSEDTCPSVR
jgi:two-component system, LytTR family, sensor kinase